MTKKKLGEILVAARAVSRRDIDAALTDQSAGEPSRLGDLLVSLGKISPHQLAKALSEQYGVPFTEIPAVAPTVLEAIPLDFQRQFRFVPIAVQGAKSVSIAMADPSYAERDVVPVLRRTWATVKVLVAASDEVDAIHSMQGGEFSGVVLPQVAPKISPVTKRSVTADELFGSLDLDPPPAVEPDPFDFSLSPVPAPAPVAAQKVTDDEEPFFFESTPPAATDASRTSAVVEVTVDDEGAQDEVEVAVAELPPLTVPAFEVPAFELADGVEVVDAVNEVPWDAARAVAAEPIPADAVAETAAFFDSQSGVVVDETVEVIEGEDDAPFFESRESGPPIAAMVDDAFVPGVPFSSPSSLAKLVIEPEPPLVAVAPPIDLPAAHSVTTAQRGTTEALPEWLQAEGAQENVGWTGALDHLAPSKLIVSVTKALIRRGVLSERDILDEAEPKKK